MLRVISANDLYFHGEFGSTDLLVDDDLTLPLIEQLISLKSTYTRDDLCSIFRDVIDLDDSLYGTVLLECFGVEDFDLQFNRAIEF
jgi:hypothetical protein